MHPPLDRPHPDCLEPIAALKECHTDRWRKYTGGCNDLKTALDQCLKAEKKRLLDEMNIGLAERKRHQEDIIAQAFGKKETFREYLAKDPDYQKEVQRKQAKSS